MSINLWPWLFVLAYVILKIVIMTGRNQNWLKNDDNDMRIVLNRCNV